jgi:predicted nucleic acid-binding protein
LTELVLDASAALELTRDDVDAALPDGRLYAPAIIDVEYLHILRRFVRMKQLTPDRARARVADWIDNELTRVQHVLLLSRIWQLRDNIATYDAAYVALAEQLSTPLVTADQRLARAAATYCDVITVGI